MSAHNYFASADARRRVDTVQAKRQTVDPARLAMLAGDPKLTPGVIAQRFGYSRSSFFILLSQHEVLWQAYEDARVRAGCSVGKTHLRVQRGGPLEGDDRKIIDAIAHGKRTVTDIAAFAEFDLRSFASRLYNLENERHEIWSMQVGRPPVTNYFLRGEESEPGAVATGSAKGKAA